MGPADSSRVSRARPYSGAGREATPLPRTGLSPSVVGHSGPVPLRGGLVTPMCPVLQPRPDESGWFRLIRFRSPLLTESRLLSSPPGNEMFQFPGFATRHLWIQCRSVRESRPQSSFDSSAGLIAVFHALRRLLAPRHPPHSQSTWFMPLYSKEDFQTS